MMQDLSTGWLQCDADPLFKPEPFALPAWIPEWVSFGIMLHRVEENYLCCIFWRLYLVYF
jgi:hypothetical protein